LGNIDNFNKEISTGIIEREGAESDLRERVDKLNKKKIDFENKFKDNQHNTNKN
jgi:hypothetical protein